MRLLGSLGLREIAEKILILILILILIFVNIQWASRTDENPGKGKFTRFPGVYLLVSLLVCLPVWKIF